MDIVSTIVGLVTTVFSRVVPDKTKQQEQEFIRLLQTELSALELTKGQIEINKAEASNPNRKWITWRELAGYFCAFAVGWQYVMFPMFDWVVKLLGFVAPPPLVLDMGSLMFLLTGMLGLAGAKSYEKRNNLTKRD